MTDHLVNRRLYFPMDEQLPDPMSPPFSSLSGFVLQFTFVLHKQTTLSTRTQNFEPRQFFSSEDHKLEPTSSEVKPKLFFDCIDQEMSGTEMGIRTERTSLVRKKDPYQQIGSNMT